jgi:hypothetical protein
MSRNQMAQQGTGKHQGRREQLDGNEHGKIVNRQK